MSQDQPQTSSLLPRIKAFTNCLVSLHGELIPQDLYFSPDTGLITPNYYYRSEGVERIDLGGRVLSPGWLELQTNGLGGVHFTELGGEGEGSTGDVEEKLARIARSEVEVGVTGWWATVPTVEKGRWREILPHLTPRPFPRGASLLGAHAEGPYLHPSKKGAHNSSYFLTPPSPEDLSSPSLPPNHPSPLYNLPHHYPSTIKLLTLAPELPNSLPLISHLSTHYPQLVLSLGHSTSNHTTGIAALASGATALTHVFNGMPALHQREPGLAGLMGHEPYRPYYSVIADGVHLHASVLRMALRTDPGRCILITDSVELAGLPDGVYPGNGQVTSRQRKVGARVTMVNEDGEGGAGEEVLIGSAITLDQCVRNMVVMTACSLAEAIRCVTENVAGMMGESRRGVLEVGRWADFVVLDQNVDDGERVFEVKETWVKGVKIYDCDEEGVNRR